MVLRPSDARELFARECRFPTTREAVIEAVGDETIASPNGDGTAIETALARSDPTTYASVAELHGAVMANLTDDHVGRKHYDDRSSTRVQETDRSF